MTPADLRLSIDILLEKTAGIVSGSGEYSFEELFDEEIGPDHPHATRMYFARAKNWAEYADDSLKRGDLDEAELAYHAAYEYLTDAALALARPSDLVERSRPAKPSGQKPTVGELLYLRTSHVLGRDGDTVDAATATAIVEDEALTTRLQGKSKESLRGMYYYARRRLRHADQAGDRSGKCA